MSIKEFVDKFGTLDQRETRALIRKRGLANLSLGSFTLLQYLVNCAWGGGQKRLVIVSNTAIENGSRLTYRAMRYNLKRLTERGLITPTENGIAVHCEPMLNWPTNKEAKAAEEAKIRKQNKINNRNFRARQAEQAAAQAAELKTLKG